MANLNPIIAGAGNAFKQLASLNDVVGQSPWDNRGVGQRSNVFDPYEALTQQYGQSWQGSNPYTSIMAMQPQRQPYQSSIQGMVNTWNANSPFLSAEEQLAKQNQTMYGGQNMSASNSVGGSSFMSSAGGDWSGVDAWNPQISAAASKTGVPANLIKAVMKLESGGANLGANKAGAIGPMQVVGSIWGGLGYNLYDPGQNIMAGATILKQNYDQYKGWAQANGIDPWKAAVYSYYAGNPYNLSAADDPSQGGSGMSTGAYGDQIWNDYQMLNTGGVGISQQQLQLGMQTDPTNTVVNMALQYVGQVPYVWGAIPGKGQDPAQTGWDCSGFTYWLDQNYGNGQLPMGSHYQYQYAQQTGQLFTNTAMLKPGDLVFWDTGNYAGSGAELNNAGHVGIYIGNGKMLHAANPDQDTIVSDFNAYLGMYTFLGAMHESFSGGNSGITGQTGMSQQSNYRIFGGSQMTPTQQGRVSWSGTAPTSYGSFGRIRW